MHDNDELIDINGLGKFYGGNDSPLHRSTIYRAIAEGRIPPPIKVGKLSRWVKSECVASRSKMAAARDNHPA